jgi:hypothetical protein
VIVVMPEPGEKIIRENQAFRIVKAMVAANKLRTGVPWIDKFDPGNQAVLDHGGMILVEGFYVRSTRRVSDLGARGKILHEGDVPE